jgi:hypothetical protein
MTASICQQTGSITDVRPCPKMGRGCVVRVRRPEAGPLSGPGIALVVLIQEYMLSVDRQAETGSNTLGLGTLLCRCPSIRRPPAAEQCEDFCFVLRRPTWTAAGSLEGLPCDVHQLQ